MVFKRTPLQRRNEKWKERKKKMDPNEVAKGAAEGFGKELARQLVPDVKSWITNLWRKLKKSIRKARIETFSSPEDLLDALKRGTVGDGNRVRIECKPSSFGQFLRNHFLVPVLGDRTDLRLGPGFDFPHPAMSILANACSYLTPVGLYPRLDEEGTMQVSLYRSDVSALGYLSVMSGMMGLEGVFSSLPSLFAKRHAQYLNMPCHVTGMIRIADLSTFADVGFTPEAFEEVRSKGDIWFLDVTDDDSEVIPLGEAETTELWGGLYAAGHVEFFEGELKGHKFIVSVHRV